MRLLTVAIVASAIAVSAIAASVGHAADGNRLTYLDVDDPYYVSASFPKLTSPMLVGDGSVDAILVLSIDDMRDAATYERFLRPTLDRLKQIDGRAPVSISACSIDPSEPHLQRWLKEGLSFEVHTVDHPCPLLSDGDFAKARSTVDRCIDNLFRIPNARPVAYRGPCSDIWNTHSPRFFTEILNKTTSAGNFLKFDSTVHHIFTKDDPEIPKAMLIDEAGRERFAKFTSGIVPIFGRHNYKYANYVANYPYPYVVSRLCWEIPIQMPGDHQAASYEPAFGHRTLTEWKAAIDVTVVKRGLMTLAFHPYGKTSNEDLLGLIDHVVDRYGKKVKFLSLRDVDELLIRNVLGGQALRASNGQDNGVRVLDVNDDGFIDVVIGNEHTRQTRIWSPKSGKWIVSGFPVMLVQVAPDGTRRDAGARFGVIDKSGLPVVIVRNESTAAAYAFDGERWVSRPDLLVGLQIDGKHVLTNADRRDRGVRLRDLNGDGVCELLVGNESQSAVFAWRAGDKRWRRLPFGLPERTAIVDSQGRDAGMRFVDLNEDSQEAGRNGARADVLFSNESHYVAARFVSLDEGFGKPVAEGQHGEGEPIPQIVADGQNNGAWLHSGRLWVTNETTDALPNHTQSVLLRDIGKPAASPPAAAPLKPKVVPHNAPAKVTADGDGALRLLAANAELYGREGPGTIAVYDAQMCIGWWKDENDYAVWTVDAPRAGRYDVFLHWSIPDPMAGNLVALEVGPHRLVASVPSTGGFEHFRLAKFGTTWLEKGPNRVKLRPLGPIKGELADLKEIRLTAVDDAVPGIPAGGTTPEQTVAGLSVPEGFEVNVFAAEPWVSNPTSICVDTKGRIWVTESSIYRHPGGTLRPDRIKVFEDVDGDGRADRATVFFEGLMSPMSLAVAGDRVYVAESPFLYVFEDRNGDLKADGPPRKLLTGFGGFNDDQSLHGLALGPDHKLYLTMGDLSFDVTGPDGIHVSHDVGAVLRCEMDGTKLEVIARDLKNPIEVAVNSFGDAWFSGNDDDGTRMTRLDYALEGGNYGWRYWGVYGERRKVFGSGPEAHWHTNVIGVVPPILMTGFGAPCGKAFIEHGMFGEAYRNTLFHADPGPRELRAYHFTQSGAAFAARRETVVGGDEDTYFRPVDVAVANDGVLYFCDWYDQGIGGHAYNDRWRGRIYSLRRKGDGHRRIGTPGPFASIDDALVALANPNVDTQFLARQKLLAAGAASVEPLRGLFDHGDDDNLRARALWLLDRFGNDARATVVAQLSNKDERYRALAVRMLGRHGNAYANAILPLANDPSARVRAEVAMAIARLSGDDAEPALVDIAAKHTGDDRYYLEAIGIAARGDTGRAQRLHEAVVGKSEKPLTLASLQLTQLLIGDEAPAYLAKRLAADKLPKDIQAAVIVALGTATDQDAGGRIIALLDSDIAVDLKRIALDVLRRNLAARWSDLRDDERLRTGLRAALRISELQADALAVANEADLAWASPEVLAIARDAMAPTSLRSSALTALGGMRTAETGIVLAEAVRTARGDVRQSAVSSLVKLLDTKVLASLLADDELAADVRMAIVRQAAATSSGALWLLSLVDEQKLGDELAKEAIMLGAKHVDTNVRLLFEKFVPADERPKTLGQTFEAQDILKLNGDAIRGRVVFVSSAASCVKCHVVQGQGGDIGPQLSTIGRKYGREAMLDAVLRPSAAISPDYVTHVVETDTGQMLVGFLRENSANRVSLKSATGEMISLARSEVVQIRPQQQSLMPEQLVGTMTAQDAADLLAYLMELKTDVQLVNKWWAAGMFPNEQEQGFDAVFEPEKSPGKPDLAATFAGVGGKEVRWREVATGALGGSVGVDLQQFATKLGFGGSNIVSYYAIGVDSPEDQQVELLLGSEDGIKVWLNGDQVHSRLVRRQPKFGDDRVAIEFRRGHNVLFVKLEQIQGGGGLIAALTTKTPVTFAKP